MKTIPEILDLAFPSLDNLPVAMMYCKVLADGRGNQDLNDWVSNELSGYPNFMSVPSCRRIRGVLGGEIWKRYESLTYEPVHTPTVGSQIKAMVETCFVHQSVSEVAHWIDDGHIAFPAPYESMILLLINNSYGHKAEFVSLDVRLPAGSIRAILLTIQAKLVGFLSEMNQVFPASSGYKTPTPKESAEISRSVEKHQLTVQNADTIINNYGSVSIDRSSTVLQQINVGSWPALEQYLHDQKVPAGRITEVKGILDEAQKDENPTETGNKLEEWFKETTEEMTSTIGDAAKDAAKKFVAESLFEGMKKYAPKVVKWGAVIASVLN